VGVLAAGVSKTITLSLTAGLAGANTLRAFVDSSCQTTESNEGNNQSTLAYNSSQRVLVLLHGMNAGPDTWDNYVGIRFNDSAPIISGGINVSGANPVADANGVVCYRVDFGWYEINGTRTGLEGITAGGTEMHGDFSTFTQLGQEVWDAVHYILTIYPGAQVTILGHSRGGLAARAFLQTATSSPEKSSVVALLTTGTPHKGSRLGRIYSYLGDAAHPRTTDTSKYWKVDWDVADKVKDGLDVRRPTISDLSDDSSAISSLSSSIANLPSNLKYGAITYTGVEFGLLKRDAVLGFDYSIFADATQTYNVGPKVSTQAETYILGTGNTPLSYLGDGIVPVTSQRYDDIPGFSGSTFTPFTHTGSTIHTDEPGQETHMSDALNTLINW
jgi:pimeloyl-ACP methyl ester carboxylesterase